MIQITEKAQEKLKLVLEKHEGAALRVYIEGFG